MGDIKMAKRKVKSMPRRQQKAVMANIRTDGYVETLAEYTGLSPQLQVERGYAHVSSSGIYRLTPSGMRVLRNVSRDRRKVQQTLKGVKVR